MINLQIFDIRIEKDIIVTFITVIFCIFFFILHRTKKMRQGQIQRSAVVKANIWKFRYPHTKIPEYFPHIVESWTSGNIKTMEVTDQREISIVTFYRKLWDYSMIDLLKNNYQKVYFLISSQFSVCFSLFFLRKTILSSKKVMTEQTNNTCEKSLTFAGINK